MMTITALFTKSLKKTEKNILRFCNAEHTTTNKLIPFDKANEFVG